jgi:hypothetical protein
VILSSYFKCHNLKARNEFIEDNSSKLDNLVKKNKVGNFFGFQLNPYFPGFGGVWVFGIDTQTNSFQW